MRYVLMQNIHNESDKFYYITNDDFSEVVGCVDLNCNPTQPAPESSVFDKYPTLPPCAPPDINP
jgi:hypothetical protein